MLSIIGWVTLFVVGCLFGGAIVSVLYERNIIGAARRSAKLRRISQLDVFELPEQLRRSIPPKSQK